MINRAHILTLFFIIPLLVLGCASSPDRFHKVVNVSAEIHIVADREQFDCNPCPAGTAAYYYKAPDGRNIIYILGNVDEGKYYTRALWLGHEIQELMAYENKDVLNPHQYGMFKEQ